MDFDTHCMSVHRYSYCYDTPNFIHCITIERESEGQVVVLEIHTTKPRPSLVPAGEHGDSKCRQSDDILFPKQRLGHHGPWVWIRF